MSNVTGCAAAPTTDPCPRCDILLGLDGVHVEVVERDERTMTVTVSSPWQLMGCPTCGVVAPSRGSRRRVLRDIPASGTQVRLVWRQRLWRCPDPGCQRGTFAKQVPSLVAPRAWITVRAVWWAINQLRREHGTILGLARQLGTAWKTLWRAVKPELQRHPADESGFHGVESLGVDEHLWHHVSTRKRGPRELTGMVDLTRDQHGHVRARLLDLKPGRSGQVLKDWLTERGEAFRAGVRIAALDPFAGYKTALDDKLADATAVLDAFHVVKVRHEALCVRMGVRDLHHLVVAAAGLKLRAA